MKKRFWIRAIKIISLLLALTLLVLLLQEFTFREYWEYGQGSIRVKGFYREPKDTLDVVLVGDSTIYAGYSPAYAYKVGNLTSYHYAIGSLVCTTWEPITRDILRRQDPQLLVVDLGGIQYDSLQKKYDASSTIHVMLDNMPLSENKLRSVRTLMDRYGDDPWEYYLPFIRYHNEWSGFGELAERTGEMLRWEFSSRNVLKGTATRVTWEPSAENRLDVRGDRSTEELTSESEEVLRAYLDYLQTQDVKVLFICMPCRINPDDESRTVFLRGNRAGEIVEEYGFDFVNFHDYTDEMGLDMEQDFYNDAHLNYRGQIKFTEFFVNFLEEEYGVTPGTLSDSLRAAWDRSAEYIGYFYEYADEQAAQGEEELLSERAEVMDTLDALREEKES